MRIAVVTEVWHPTVNGVVTRLAATVEQLRATGHEVLVVAPRHQGGVECGAEAHWVRAIPTVGVPFVYGGQRWGLPLPRVGRYLADFEPDVVHVANPALLGIAGVLAARRQGVPLVCSYHTDLAAYAPFYHLGWTQPVIRRSIQMLHRAAAVNLATSNAARTQLLGTGVDGVRLWPRGVNLDRYRPDASRRSADGPRIALYVGRLADEKGLDALDELTERPDIHLVVVGDGPARGRVAQQWSSGSVTFTGVLHDEELAAAYRQADVFVFPSTTETLGLVLLEALASGLPVVAASSPASREVLGDCRAARLFTPEQRGALSEAISDLLESAPRTELARQARAAVAGDTWETATASLVEHYHAAASMPRRTSSDRLPRQFSRFLAVGASNAVIDLGVFNLLDALHPTGRPAVLVAYNTVAVLLALVNSYLLNSRWTFRQADSPAWRAFRHRRRLLFGFQGLCNLVVNDLVVAGAAALLVAETTLPHVVVANASKLAGMLTASLLSFAACRLIVFRGRDQAGTSPGDGEAPVAPVEDQPRVATHR